MNEVPQRKHITQLKAIVDKNHQSDSMLVSKLEKGDIDHDERRRLVDIVSEEFADRGLEVNDEPNAYGNELEDLIDVLNRED